MNIERLREALKSYYDSHPTDDNGYALAEWAEDYLEELDRSAE